jgi:hypothetical protein
MLSLYIDYGLKSYYHSFESFKAYSKCFDKIKPGDKVVMTMTFHDTFTIYQSDNSSINKEFEVVSVGSIQNDDCIFIGAKTITAPLYLSEDHKNPQYAKQTLPNINEYEYAYWLSPLSTHYGLIRKVIRKR